MPIYIADSSGNLIGWEGGAESDTTPPDPPTGVQAVAGDGQVTISWDPSPAADIASYSVRQANPSNFLDSVAHPTTEYIATGLTNGTSYDFVVRAVDATGNVSANSALVSATPVASGSSVVTKYGYNVDAPQAPLSSRLVKWANRAPLIRNYYGSNWINSTFGLTTGTHPERGSVYTWKAGGFSTSALANGAGNSRVIDWLESIPGDPNPWHVPWGFWHEPNFSGGLELPVADFLGIYEQLRICLDTAQLQPGVVAPLCVNFMAYQIGDGVSSGLFRDSWVPDPSICDQITWDVYLNPGNYTSQVLAPNCASAGGPEYGASFPNTATRHRDWMRATIRNGYGDDGRWSIWEYNGPPRDWDGPTNPDYVCGSNKRLRYQGGRTAPGHDATHTEVERAAALVAGLEYFQSRPTFAEGTLGIPDHILIWEHLTGVNWNQHFYHDNVWNALKPYFENSPGAL